eukprot:2331382-Alexandrium_andersonii.AAC.1
MTVSLSRRSAGTGGGQAEEALRAKQPGRQPPAPSTHTGRQGRQQRANSTECGSQQQLVASASRSFTGGTRAQVGSRDKCKQSVTAGSDRM